MHAAKHRVDDLGIARPVLHLHQAIAEGLEMFPRFFDKAGKEFRIGVFQWIRITHVRLPLGRRKYN